MAGAEGSWSRPGKMTEGPGKVALIIEAEVERNSAQWQLRVGQALGRGVHAHAVQVLAQRFTKFLAEGVAKVNGMNSCRSSHLGQRQVFIEMGMHIFTGAAQGTQVARHSL